MIKKHSTVFGRMMEELGLDSSPEHFFDSAPWQVQRPQLLMLLAEHVTALQLLIPFVGFAALEIHKPQFSPYRKKKVSEYRAHAVSTRRKCTGLDEPLVSFGLQTLSALSGWLDVFRGNSWTT